MEPAYSLEIGKSATKVTNRDELLMMMRLIIKQAKGRITRTEAVERWREQLADHPHYEALIDQIEEHFGLLLFQRCAVPVLDDAAAVEKSERLRRRVRETVAAEIALSSWMVPTIGKPLSDCTFAEVAEAAPIAGRFLAKLASQGAPGSLVKEVFPSEDALQLFWTQAQGIS